MLTSLSFHFKQAHSRLIVPVKLVYCNQISRRSFCSSNETNSIDFNDPNQWIKQQMYETYIKKPYQTLSVDLFRPLIQNHHDESKVQRILELYEQAKQSELIMPKTLDLFNMENLMHVIDDRFKVIAYFVYAARIERSRHRKTLIKKMKASLPPSFSSVPSVPSSSSLSSTLASSADLTRPDEMDAGNASRTGILFNSQGALRFIV